MSNRYSRVTSRYTAPPAARSAAAWDRAVASCTYELETIARLDPQLAALPTNIQAAKKAKARLAALLAENPNDPA